MSRSGYCEDYDDDNLSMGRWRGVVASAIRGRRGQKFLKDLLAALDALPEKRLIADDLAKERVVDPEAGTTKLEVCAIGALGVARGVDMSKLDPDDCDSVAGAFNIATPLAQEVVYMNDEAWYGLSPEDRFVKMREWISSLIKPEAPAA